MPPLFETPLHGRVRVGIPDDFDEGVLERVLADFTKSNPGVEILAKSGCTEEFPDEIKRGKLDIAVCTGVEMNPQNTILKQQPVWVASETMYLSSKSPIPLAVINHGCWLGELPTVTLKRHKKPFHIAFECSGLMSLKSAIRAGFAVGILLKSNVEPRMKVLSQKDGFPSLPIISRSILVSPNIPENIANAMTNAIKRAV